MTPVRASIATCASAALSAARTFMPVTSTPSSPGFLVKPTEVTLSETVEAFSTFTYTVDLAPPVHCNITDVNEPSTTGICKPVTGLTTQSTMSGGALPMYTPTVYPSASITRVGPGKKLLVRASIVPPVFVTEMQPLAGVQSSGRTIANSTLGSKGST